jgi:hypothetical protein
VVSGVSKLILEAKRGVKTLSWAKPERQAYPGSVKRIVKTLSWIKPKRRRKPFFLSDHLPFIVAELTYILF